MCVLLASNGLYIYIYLQSLASFLHRRYLAEFMHSTDTPCKNLALCKDFGRFLARCLARVLQYPTDVHGGVVHLSLSLSSPDLSWCTATGSQQPVSPAGSCL